MLFSDKFRVTSLMLVFKCSMALMLLPSRFKCVNWVSSLSPSIVRMPL